VFKGTFSLFTSFGSGCFGNGLRLICCLNHLGPGSLEGHIFGRARILRALVSPSLRAAVAACFSIGAGIVLGASPYTPPFEGKNVVDGAGNEFVSILGGDFQMGDAGEANTPIQTVFVQSFHIATTEVTLQEWKRVLEWAKRNGYQLDHPGTGNAEDHPVADISWYDAVKWSNAKSEMEGLKPCYFSSASRAPSAVYRKGRLDLLNAFVDWHASGYRLPTEAEWEKAARGGLTGLKYPHGNEIGKDVANFSMSTRNSGSVSVGSYEPNRYGLFDMAGNVQEWCWDRYAADGYKTSGKKDPKGGDTGSDRVNRGGGWYGNAGKCRVARRDFFSPNTAVGSLGFRLVRP
jgi:formylglycine-generating enzyme required for sulfatase activity